MEDFREKRLESKLKSQNTTIIVLGVILMLCVIGVIYLMIRNNRINDEADMVARERTEILSNLQTTEESNLQLESQIDSLDLQITQLSETTAGLEEQIQARNRSIAQLRSKYPDLEKELQEEIAEREALEVEYNNLRDEREELVGKMGALNQELTSLREEYEAQSALVEEATYLQAYNISVINLSDRWLWFKPVIMDNAGRVDRTIVSFEINSNILVEPDEKEVYLILINPGGEVVNASEETFDIAEPDTVSHYSAHTVVNYERQRIPLEFTIEHDGLEEGTHAAEVYIDGELAGRSEFTLE